MWDALRVTFEGLYETARVPLVENPLTDVRGS